MNRSMLLVICDFLILSLLALARFDDAEVRQPAEEPELAKAEEVTAEEDVAEMLKLSLEEEQAAREELDKRLEQTEEQLKEREQRLAQTQQNLQQTQSDLESTKATAEELARRKAEMERQREALAREKERLQQEREQLAGRYEQTRQNLEKVQEERAALAGDVAELRETTAVSSERMKAIQEELQAKQQALANMTRNLEELSSEKRIMEAQNKQLETELKVAETEKRFIAQNLQRVEGEVESVKAEKEMVQEQAGRLAEGVTLLAESSEQIRDEIKKIKPLSMNTIYETYKHNQVAIRFITERGLLFGEENKDWVVPTVLVSDQGNTYAVFHIGETPFADERVLPQYDILKAHLRIGKTEWRLPSVNFLESDPRLLSVRVPGALVTAQNLTPFPLTLSPHDFPEAVVIDTEEDFYGQASYTIFGDNERYIKMKKQIFSALFGEFSPSQGDLVFAKTGELMGVMVNNDYAVLLQTMLVSQTVPVGQEFSPSEAETSLALMETWASQKPSELR